MTSNREVVICDFAEHSPFSTEDGRLCDMCSLAHHVSRQYDIFEDALVRPGDPLPNHGLFDDGIGIVATEQLTPGIPKSEYEDRRRRLMDRLPDNSRVMRIEERGGRWVVVTDADKVLEAQ